MKRIYEGVEKHRRKAFKHFMDYPKCRYNFKKDIATVTLDEPYAITDESLQNKSTFKRAMQQGIIEFRNYCFNQQGFYGIKEGEKQV